MSGAPYYVGDFCCLPAIRKDTAPRDPYGSLFGSMRPSANFHEGAATYSGTVWNIIFPFEIRVVEGIGGGRRFLSGFQCCPIGVDDGDVGVLQKYARASLEVPWWEAVAWTEEDKERGFSGAQADVASDTCIAPRAVEVFHLLGCITEGYRPRFIGGAVVNDEDFRTFVRLSEEALDSFLEERASIVAENDCRETEVMRKNFVTCTRSCCRGSMQWGRGYRRGGGRSAEEEVPGLPIDCGEKRSKQCREEMEGLFPGGGSP